MNDFSMRIAAHYQVGDRVTHPMLGDGTVTGVDAIRVTVDFDKRGTRAIVLKMALLSPMMRVAATRG